MLYVCTGSKGGLDLRGDVCRVRVHGRVEISIPITIQNEIGEMILDLKLGL
jgi:hypothetical protein